ncbi:MAG: hypothetical protein IT443_08880 [Phycisphaeraceae bacterium]|nr:hypothetical protein [Phycisphaeraceae bacterium]
MSSTPNYPMSFGVDDAGKKLHVYQDPHLRAAIERLGFSFLMHHIYGPARIDDVRQLSNWAKDTGCAFIPNQENTDRPQAPADASSPYRKPGCFFQPTAEYVDACLASPDFLGFCYDEAEHWTCNGVWVTDGKSRERGQVPHFYNAQGDDLFTAYEGNLHNINTLLHNHFAKLRLDRAPASDSPRPHVITTEHVFPTLYHLFARAGLTPTPKYMKETITPVAAAMTLGAVKQYGCPYWACLDLWGVSPNWPGHTPQELISAMLFAYWTGADHAYVENINFRDSLYRVQGDAIELSPWGQAAAWFAHEYLPAHPRPFCAADYQPHIAIVRFPDSDWGQVPRAGYITGSLYGASNLMPDEQTRAWIKIWHVLSHGQIPPAGLTWHADLQIPFRFFFPSNGVIVYDHLAADPDLFHSVKLVFLTGKFISQPCLATLERLVERGLTVVTPPHLAPPQIASAGSSTSPAVHTHQQGAWIVTSDVTHPDLRARLAPFLGRPDEMTFRFGDTQIAFSQPSPSAPIHVASRPACA